MKRLRYACLLLCLFTVLGCAVDYGAVRVKDGQRYGVTSGWTFRGKWWDYYERGVSYAAGHFWPDAVADLQEALRRTPAGQDNDRYEARTYGFHFLGYFPHRELGIAYFYLGRYTDAMAELETSLRAVETAKAKFYLNEVRRVLLIHNGSDTTPPRLVLESPVEGAWTNRFSLEVRGRAEDDTYVRTVRINGRPLFIELAEPRLPFTQHVPVHEGINVIEVVASDLLGQTTRLQRTVYVNRQGPLLDLQHVDVLSTPGQRARVAGWVTDASPLQRFLLAGRTVPLTPEGAFETEVPLHPGMTAVPFEAEDAAGNVTRGAIPLPSPARTAPGMREGQQRTPAWTRWAAVTAADVVADLPTVAFTWPWPRSQVDRDPPVIDLRHVSDQQRIDAETLYVEGRVSDQSAIIAFTLNGHSLWRRKSRQLFFGTLVPLREGENPLHFEAVDEAGNTQRRELVVLRYIPPVRRLQERLAVGIPRFSRGDETSLLGEQAYTRLLEAFVEQARFRVVERERLDTVLFEQRINLSTLVDPRTAVGLGKLVQAEGLVIGVVLTRQPATLEVFAEFVDVETGTVVATADVYGEHVTHDDIVLLMQGLESKIRGHFPLVEGAITGIEGRRLFVDLCGQRPLREPMKLLLFREQKDAHDPVTGQARLTRIDKVGEARITHVHRDTCETVIEQVTPGTHIQQLDKAITK